MRHLGLPFIWIICNKSISHFSTTTRDAAKDRGGQIELQTAYTSSERLTRDIFQACVPVKLLFGMSNWYAFNVGSTGRVSDAGAETVGRAAVVTTMAAWGRCGSCDCSVRFDWQLIVWCKVHFIFMAPGVGPLRGQSAYAKSYKRRLTDLWPLKGL